MENCAVLLRQRALSRIPTIQRSTHDYLVAVVPHSIYPEACTPNDFVWFRCQAKHTVEKIRRCYKQRAGCVVDLYTERGKPSDVTGVPQLDYHSDRVLIVQAREIEGQATLNASLQATRSPLQPTSDFTSPRLNTTAEKMTKNPRKTSKATSASPSPPINIKQESGIHKPLQAGRYRPSSDASPSHSPRRFPHNIKVDPADASAHVPFRSTSNMKKEVSPDSTLESNTAPEGSRYAHIGSSVPSVAPATASSRPLPSASQNRLFQLLEQGSPALLESEVGESEILLEQIRSQLSNLQAQSPETQQWLQQIETLKQRKSNEPTIIGVVGNTGAGKSSVINAMLDEERLVPTNCMRACTAVVTEISWNPSDDEGEKYRAEIVFISPADWEKELKILYAEVLDGNGKISGDVYKADTEAGIAYAKIRAVYPKKTKDDLGKSSVNDLMREPAVLNVLGQTIMVAEAQSDRFYNALQSFVDSKEKSTEDKRPRKEMELWPLIKVVKIYTKADALSTGAVIVDLPGVHDSNAARSAIAQNYMKTCTGLWIVAPITRAVDDKAAKSLLGDSFKRQLKYDGTYSRVTFICSKTDDISVTEASDSLGLQEEISPKWDRYDQIEADLAEMSRELKALSATKDMYREILNDTEDQLEVWDKLGEDLEDGMTVYAPSTLAKRKKAGNSLKQRKKRTLERDHEDDDSADENFREEDAQTEAVSQKEPLTVEVIREKLAELRETKKQARRERREAEGAILLMQEHIDALNDNRDEIEAEISAICITGRNQYSKGAIQQDFAAGIKELDQENQFEDNEAEFNPDEDLRDYAEVARSLPVFCVSSRAYQQLSGRLQRDQIVPGFGSLQETEVPQLQAHCKKLTEAGRVLICRRFLNGFSQLINSMSLWASGNGSGTPLTDAQVATEEHFLHVKLSQLENQLENVVQNCLNQMKEELASNIYDRFDQVVSTAVDKANATASRWGAPMNRLDRAAGGLHWCTYKAVVRRDGCFNNGILHDFNLQLTEPIMKQLGSGWETAFARRLPRVLESFTASCKKILHSFHEDVASRVALTGNGIVSLAMLSQQLQNYERIFHDLTGQMLQVITENQREANREFTPVIARHLLSAYQYCAAESGTGSFMRMKEHLTGQIDEHRSTMFHDSTQEVKKHLSAMCRRVEEHMLNKADEVFTLMRRDYMTAITGAYVPQGYEMPRPLKKMKSEIVRIIREREEAAERWERKMKKSEESDEDDEGDEVRCKKEEDESSGAQSPAQTENFIASEWAAYDEEQEDVEDQILRESFKREEE